MIKKRPDGKWKVDVQPGGRGQKRYTRIFRTQADAKAYETWVQGQVQQQPGWAEPKADRRRYSELVELWWNAHGQSLAAGKNTKARLLAIGTTLRNPPANAFTASMFTTYRAKRIDEGLAPATANRELAYVRSMFNELKRIGEWKGENPVAAIRGFRVQETELTWLSLEQVAKLLSTCERPEARNAHLPLIVRVALSTGARWSEAEELRISQVRDDHLYFVKTKNGRARSVPVDPELTAALRKHHEDYSEDDRIFGTAYSAFRKALDVAEIELPDGQLTHVLRHTFASHFVQSGGNIVALQKLLGHSDLKTTMRYAHLAPGHLADARTLNPLTKLKAAGVPV